MDAQIAKVTVAILIFQHGHFGHFVYRRGRLLRQQIVPAFIVQLQVGYVAVVACPGSLPPSGKFLKEHCDGPWNDTPIFVAIGPPSHRISFSG